MTLNADALISVNVALADAERIKAFVWDNNLKPTGVKALLGSEPNN